MLLKDGKNKILYYVKQVNFCCQGELTEPEVTEIRMRLASIIGILAFKKV